MADATININAVDKTRAAFLSVDQKLRTMSARSVNMQREIIRGGLGLVGAGGVLALITREARFVTQNIEKIPGISPEVVNSVEAMNIAFTKSRDAVRGYIAEGMGWFSQLGQNIGIAAGAMIYGTEAAADAYDQLNAAAAESVRLRKEAAKADELRPYLEQMKRAEQAAGKAMAPLVGQALKGRQALDALRASVSRIQNELGNTGEGSVDELKKRIELYGELSEKARQLIAAEQQHRELAREAGRILSNGFEDAVFAGGKLRDVVNALVSDIGRMMFRNVMFGSGGTGGIFGGIGSFFGSMFGGGKATGGGVSSGKSYMVGENGPEMFTPSAAGTITPNHRMGDAAGSTFNVTINAPGADPAQLNRVVVAVQELHASFDRRAVGAVISAKQRGGGPGRALS